MTFPVYPKRFTMRPTRLLLCLFGLLLCCATGCQNEMNQLIERVPITPPPLPTRLPQSEAPIAQETPVAATALQGLSTGEQLQLVVVPTRDLRDLTLRFDPEINEIPLVVNTDTPEYQVGDLLDFWVHNLDSNSNSQIQAELVYKTDVVYVWVEAGEEHDLAAIRDSIDHFSAVSYPAEVDFFGSEWYPGVDNDPRLHILHATTVGNGVAGYYSSADQYSRLANPFSNEKEMFYVNLRWLNSSKDYGYYETVLAHEFQHMIHWANDRNEETWVNEGLSEYAQEVAGYGTDTVFANAFARQPDTQLNTWRVDTATNAEHYGSAYLMINYLSQRFGQETTRALVADEGNGIQGITNALQASGHSEDFDEVFADWTIANYLDEPTALGLAGVYGYTDLDLPTPPVEEALLDFALDGTDKPYTATVNNYATDYIALPPQTDLTFTFQGQNSTRLAGTTPYSGAYAWWSNRGDDSNSRLTRQFDLSTLAAGTPISMTAAMWWNIEPDYDFGYVLASRDGQKWQMLTGERMTSENTSGNNFGIGYSSNSTDGNDQAVWVIEEFDLSPYAGETIWLRFEYVTDDAANGSGWLVDDLQIAAIGYATDFESDLTGWESEGWLLTDNLLTQRWLLQRMVLDDDQLVSVEPIPVDERGAATFTTTADTAGEEVILVVSALAPVTTEAANYTIEVRP